MSGTAAPFFSVESLTSVRRSLHELKSSFTVFKPFFRLWPTGSQCTVSYHEGQKRTRSLCLYTNRMTSDTLLFQRLTSHNCFFSLASYEETISFAPTVDVLHCIKGQLYSGHFIWEVYDIEVGGSIYIFRYNLIYLFNIMIIILFWYMRLLWLHCVEVHKIAQDFVLASQWKLERKSES